MLEKIGWLGKEQEKYIAIWN